jgi:DNA-binding MarR family transcriptional regulator
MTTDTFSLHFLLHAAALLEERLRERLAKIGIRPRQARIIDALSRIEPASQVSLAREFDITPASMSTMTVRLIEAGFISREPHPDEARSNVLRLTTRGRGLLSEIHAAWRDIDALIVERLGAENAETLARTTRDLRDSLGGRVPGAGTTAPKDTTKEPL